MKVKLLIKVLKKLLLRAIRCVTRHQGNESSHTLCSKSLSSDLPTKAFCSFGKVCEKEMESCVNLVVESASE